MRNPAQLSDRSRFLVSLAITTLLGGAFGAAAAQQRPPGSLDAQCLNDCAAQGYESEHCNKICWVADPATGRPGEVTDWVCMTDCANRGGRYSDCKQRCRLR